MTGTALSLRSITGVVDDRQDAAAWARLIENTMTLSRDAIIETGRHLIDAKAALGHGNWLSDLEAHFVQISARTAQRLMAIASYEPLIEAHEVSRALISHRNVDGSGDGSDGGSNATTLADSRVGSLADLYLPDGFMGLYHLTNLTPDEFRQVTTDGSLRRVKSARGTEKLVREVISNRTTQITNASANARGTPPEIDAVEAEIVDPDDDDHDHDPDIDDLTEDFDEAAAEEAEATEDFAVRFGLSFPLGLSGVPEPVGRLIRVVALSFDVSVQDLMRARHARGQTRDQARLARDFVVKILHGHLGWSQPQSAAPFGLESSTISRICAGIEDRFDYRPWEEFYDALCSLTDAFRLHSSVPSKALPPVDAPALEAAPSRAHPPPSGRHKPNRAL